MPISSLQNSRKDEPPRSVKQRRRRRKLRTRLELITTDNIDARSRAHRVFSRIVDGISEDLGGKDRLSTVEATLVDAYAGVAVHLYDLNAKLLLGEPVDLGDHALAVSAMVRVASRIGTERRPKDITTLSEYLKSVENETIEGEASDVDEEDAS